MSWYVKTKRAQSSIDDEKWVEGAVHPTLNAFDVGDTRAVALVVYPIDTRNALRDPEKKDAVNRQGLGVGKAGDPSSTLTSLFVPAVAVAEEEEMVHCLGGHHPNASITEDVCCTLTSAMGLGGGHIPLVAVSEEEMQTYPIQGTVIGRKDTAGPQGKGYGDSSDPMFTLDTTGGHAVAMTEDDGTIVFHPHRTDGFRIQGETINTLTAFMGTGGLNTPMVAKTGVAAYDEYNDSISETHHTLRAGTKQSTGVLVPESVVAPTLSASNNPSRSPQSSEVTAQIDAMVKATSVVRRLTPVECERLQGFPDGWTDGQADSHRYKQMGNAVTVNVIAWIGSRLD